MVEDRPQRKAFVTRAGDKLAFALDHFGIAPEGLICADLGCHAGGFTDCLLQRGAARVYSVDTGHNILDWNLRTDPRVVVMERANALHVELPEAVDLVSVDVGWTRQRLVLPHAMGLVKPGGTVISLLKTHYEALPEERKGGKVREGCDEGIVSRTVAALRELGLTVAEVVESPVRGGKAGNREYLLLLRS